MNTLAPSFLIGSSSFLPVTRTYMKAWMSSNFGKFATELRPGIRKSDFRPVQTDLDFLGPFCFAKNVKKSVQKLTFFR